MGVGYFAHSFDLINVGDLDLVQQARELCSTLVVGVLTDEQIESTLGRLPVVPLVERMALVEHVRGVDVVVEHGPTAGADADLVFVVGEAADTSTLPDLNVVTLVPRRRTASALMRAALQPVLDESVAS